jgi:hypothetical protein
MAAGSSSGYRTQGEKDSPGGAYKRNFNLNPRGKLPLRPITRAVPSRSKSRATR